MMRVANGADGDNVGVLNPEIGIHVPANTIKARSASQKSGSAATRTATVPVEPASLACALEGAEGDAGREADDHCGSHQQQRSRYRIGEHRNDGPALSERFTQITRRNALQEQEVLLGDRTIEPIPCAKCLSHLGGGARVVEISGEWFSRRGVNQEEREGRRQPDDEQTLRHPLQDDARHVRAKIREITRSEE